MTTHMTLRLAWHNDGWNGRICSKPERNVWCVGCASYPGGGKLRVDRDLAWEQQNAGLAVADLDKPPACMYSVSAFSDRPSPVLAAPPDFWDDDTETKLWELPPATACTWPYDAMYNKDDIKKNGVYDYDKRLEYANEYFKPLQQDSSLVFYYANYSNPLSEDDSPVYLLVGVARLKQVADLRYYDGCSPKVIERYKGFIWQRDITTHYPEQGLRLPYHRYLDNMDNFRKFAVVPDNSALCKYASRHVSDDEALGLIEQLLQAVRILHEDLEDESENWEQRIAWLESLIAELWRSRGAYPGMPAVLEHLGLQQAIDGFRSLVLADKELDAVTEIRDFVAGKRDSFLGYHPLTEELKQHRRQLSLAKAQHKLLFDVISRCAVTTEQLKAILDEQRVAVGLQASLDDIASNPYLLAEQYTGKDANDIMRWSLIDRGMLPSPQLSAKPLFLADDPARFRALLLETLRGNAQQTFLKAQDLLDQVNARIKLHPEWKQKFITAQYLEVDKEFFDKAIYQREEASQLYLYDLKVWEDERLVARVLNDLLVGSTIAIPRPVPDTHWHSLLFDEESVLAKQARKEYREAVDIQMLACKQVLNKRLAAITGGAGTGKTTILAALIRAMRHVHGPGTGVAVIAPTGKATDRLRSKLKGPDLSTVHVATIHSILAKYGWLNSNMTFKPRGGKKLADYSTLIIDESSMIDLRLMAALFRAIEWSSITRLILVGDAAQLPPIGVGKVYADVIRHLQQHAPDHLVKLRVNLRQLDNVVNNKGNGIIELASCFINATAGTADTTPDIDLKREELIRDLHAGGAIRPDLSIHYWDEADQMQQSLLDTVTADLRTEELQDKRPAEVWGKRMMDNINVVQILSPVRGEMYGTEALNIAAQNLKSEHWLKRGNVDGITLFDKVIQVVNRPASDPYYAYDFSTKEKDVEVQVFNGEIGTATPLGSHWKKFKWPDYQVRGIAVKFFGKEQLSISFGRDGKWTYEKVEGNIELAYAISVHKAQGSEFERVYFVLPRGRASSQMMELIYTALTRASTHCTLFVEGSVETLVNAMRPEQSALASINSSLFEFIPVPDALARRADWYEAGKIHEALTNVMVRSKSEVIIANMLHERGMTFLYEKPLVAPSEGTLYLPDFTVLHRGEEYYWEHLGMLDVADYRKHWEEKRAWYDKHFPGKLLTTREGGDLSRQASEAIEAIKQR